MKKRIIFFDADGTLWYPKSTKYSKHPIWVWETHNQNVVKVREEFVLIPGVLKILKKLKKLKIKLVVLSTCPLPKKEANIRVKGNVSHFNLEDFFDEIHGTRIHHESKGKYILRILKKYKIPKKYALMIGDSYRYDYKPARNRGVDALLIETDYSKIDPHAKKIKKTIKKLNEIFNYL